MTPEEIRNQGVFPAGFMPLPHPNHPEGGMVFPKFHIDEIKKQEAARPDALRSRLRSARPFAARVSAADLPDHAARPGRRVARASWSRSTTSTSCSTAFSIPSSSKACGCWSRRFRSSSSTRPTTAASRQAASRRGLLRLPRQRPHQRAPRTWSATSGRRSSATASTRRRCAA